MYKKILAPLDGSEFGECGLSHVKAIASGCQVPEVVLLHVIEPIPHTGVMANELGGDFIKSMEEESQLAVEKNLSKIVDDLGNAGISATAEIIKGRPDDEILKYADKNNVDLIVMSTHGSSGIVRWAIGSIADRVVRHSQIPVLVATPKACRIN
jgi:nucleotide-binding universal stress UspA family protein